LFTDSLLVLRVGTVDFIDEGLDLLFSEPILEQALLFLHKGAEVFIEFEDQRDQTTVDCQPIRFTSAAEHAEAGAKGRAAERASQIADCGFKVAG
jgi:hypothetical protein